MFAIYNNGSVGFRSTADNLYNLKNVEALSESRLKPDEGFIQDFTNAQKEQKNLNENAINTYKKMANIDTTEPVYHVQDIMTQECIYINNQSTILNAYNVLKEHKVSQIPVVSFGKKIVGMINKKIILNLLMDDIENSKHILDKKIEDIYLNEVITADPISDIRRVAKVMIDFKLDAIPIVDENDILVGIVSKTDIIKAVSYIPRLQLWS
uniref:CBS domain-containing protein n=1 Tax=Aliarcobacter sp. TaxID=2321116 RepID=UPI0040480DFD